MIQLRTNTATEGAINRSFNAGVTQNAGAVMVLQEQYISGAAIANSTTETSLYTIAKFVPSMAGSVYTSPSTLVTIPANYLSLGLLYTGKIVGSIANTGTPNLRTRVVLRNSAGTVTYTISDTTATAMTTVSTVDFEVNFDMMVASVGTTGSVVGRISHRYATTTVYAAPAAVTVDTTAQYTIDVLLTWGAASASNTVTPFWSVMEIR